MIIVVRVMDKQSLAFHGMIMDVTAIQKCHFFIENNSSGEKFKPENILYEEWHSPWHSEVFFEIFNFQRLLNKLPWASNGPIFWLTCVPDCPIALVPECPSDLAPQVLEYLGALSTRVPSKSPPHTQKNFYQALLWNSF